MFKYSFMTRCRMKKILDLLEQNKNSEVFALISSPKFARALAVLSDIGCVKVKKAWGNVAIDMWLLDKYATYQLERYDIWVNRIGGFIFGVIACVVTQLIVGLLP